MLIRIFKILVAAASVAYTVLLYTQGSWGAAIGMTLLSIVLVLANLRSVRLVFAFANLRMQRMEEAVKWLNRIQTSQLWPGQRGYYHFLLGSVTMQNNLNEAESHLEQSPESGSEARPRQGGGEVEFGRVHERQARPQRRPWS